MDQQKNEDKGAGDWIRSKIKTGEVGLDGQDLPDEPDVEPYRNFGYISPNTTTIPPAMINIISTHMIPKIEHKKKRLRNDIVGISTNGTGNAYDDTLD